MTLCKRRTRVTIPALALFLLVAPTQARADGWGRCPTAIREKVDKADRASRGKSSKGLMSMKVYKRGTMSITMRYWSVGRYKFLAKVRRPSRLKGMATLKSGKNLWSYIPRQDRIVKLGSSMMGQSWMGSHFSNDDLVKETDLRKHYTCIGYTETTTHYVVRMKPRPRAPVVWGKIVMKLTKKPTLAVWMKYYDERGSLQRTMKFQDVRNMGGRTFPTRMVLQPANAPSERTVVTFHSVRFNTSIPSRKFTLQGLKR